MKKKKNKKPELIVPPKPQPETNEQEKKFDFGGLPNRDLKKNLGCG